MVVPAAIDKDEVGRHVISAPIAPRATTDEQTVHRSKSAGPSFVGAGGRAIGMDKPG